MKTAIIASTASWHTLRWYRSLKDKTGIRLFTFLKGFKGFGEDEVLVNSVWPGKLKFLFGHKNLKAKVREYNPDIVHAHYATGFGYLASRLNMHPLVISVWGSDIFDFPNKSSFHKNLLGKILAGADAICATSLIISEAVKSHYPELAGKIHIIPFGIDMRRFSPGESTAKSGKIVIGTAKLLQKHYQIDKLMIMFDNLAKSNPGLFLKIAGQGEERVNLEKLKAGLESRERIEFMGQVGNDDMPAFLRELDIFVMPSRFESFGVAALEASACGLPVVAFDAGGVGEIVEDGVSGRLVKGGDLKGMEDAIYGLVSDDSRRLAMGKAGRKLVLEKYDITKSASMMYELYCSLLGNKSR